MKTDEQGRMIIEVMHDGGSGDVLRDVPLPLSGHTMKKATRRPRKTDDRMQLQIRVGAKLIENMDIGTGWLNRLRKGDREESRTSLGCRAIQRRLDGNGWCPGRTTADVLVGNRQPLLIRVPREMMAAIDGAAEALGVTRTVWVLDAVLAELAQIKEAMLKQHALEETEAA